MTTNIKTLQFKVLKLERRLKGLCLNCGAPAKVKADGTKARLCADCMKKNYKYSAAYHQRKRQEKAIEDSIVSLVYNAEYMSQEEKEAFNSFLSTDKGKSMVKALSSAASQGKEIVEGVTESQEFQDLYSSVKSSLSPESFERLMEETKSSSEALFSKFKK